MNNIFNKLKSTIDATIPDKEELTHGLHPKLDYLFLVFRNLFVVAAVVFFILAFLLHGSYGILKGIGYFCGASAYVFECLALTDCFKKKVPHSEMFMIYCFGPLYILSGLVYILWH